MKMSESLPRSNSVGYQVSITRTLTPIHLGKRSREWLRRRQELQENIREKSSSYVSSSPSQSMPCSVDNHLFLMVVKFWITFAHILYSRCYERKFPVCEYCDKPIRDGQEEVENCHKKPWVNLPSLWCIFFPRRTMGTRLILCWVK